VHRVTEASSGGEPQGRGGDRRASRLRGTPTCNSGCWCPSRSTDTPAPSPMQGLVGSTASTLSSLRIIPSPVLHPLPDIATHVIESQGIRLSLTHWMGFSTRILIRLLSSTCQSHAAPAAPCSARLRVALVGARGNVLPVTVQNAVYSSCLLWGLG